MEDIIEFSGTMEIIEAYELPDEEGEYYNDSITTHMMIVIARCQLTALKPLIQQFL